MPVYSVDTEEEAEALIAATCSVDSRGTYYSRELSQEQTLERLYAFGDRLREEHARLRLQPGWTLGAESRSPAEEGGDGVATHSGGGEGVGRDPDDPAGV